MARKLSELLPLRAMLEGWVTAHELAEAIYQRYPAEVKDRIGRSQRDTFATDVAVLLSGLLPEERSELREVIRLLFDTVSRLVDEVHGRDGDGVFTDQDLDLILFFTEVVTALGTVSRRDVIRLRDAIDAGDAAYLVMQHLPSAAKTGRRQKVEVKFTHDMPQETIEALHLKQP